MTRLLILNLHGRVRKKVM